MKKINIAKGIDLPVDIVTQTIAILAKRRAGKSYTMRRLAEQLLEAGQQIVFVDPKGDQWGIRSSADGKKPGFPIVILGGEHGDAPLEPSAGEVVAKLVVEERVSILLDLSVFRKHEIASFMAIFLENLYRLKAQEAYRTPVMLVIDEADAIAPQKPQKGEERMLGAAEDIVRRGGQRGIGCALITQRSAVLNKNVLTQAQMLIVLRTIAPQDLAAMKAWIDVHGSIEEGKQLIESLPSLPIGDAWFWSPGWPTEEGIFARAHVLPIQTFDSGATPKPGMKPVVPKNLADVDLNALKKQMAATIEKAKADDPKALRKRIGELEQMVKKNDVIKFKVKETYVPDEAVLSKVRTQANQKAGIEWEKVVKCWKKLAENYLSMIDHLHKTAHATILPKDVPPDWMPPSNLTSIIRMKPIDSFIPIGSPVARESKPVYVPTSEDDLTGPEHKVLNALAWCESIGIEKPPNELAAFLSGYSHFRSTGYTNPRGYLKSKGLIDYSNGSIFLTSAGRAQAEAPETPLTQEALHAAVLERLDGPERKLLKPLFAAYPEGISNTDLCAQAGYAHERSTGYTNPRGRLKSFGLIDYQNGVVIANDFLFLNR